MSSHWKTYVGEIFYFGCCDSLQRHWMMWFEGFTPCRSNCKVHRYIDNGTCKKNVVNLFFKLMKIKRIISDFCH